MRWTEVHRPCRLKPALPIAALLLVVELAAADNLVLNGDFSLPRADHADQPLAWGRCDGLGVRWADAPGGGRAIRMDTAVSERDMVAQWQRIGSTEWDVPNPTGDAIGATYGLSLYSDAIDIARDQAYAVELRSRGVGGGKVWVRGYRRDGEQLKRIYEAQAEVKPSDGWQRTVYAFHPTRHTPKVAVVKVMLYAYWPAGELWFDDVVLRSAPPDELAAEDARRKRP
jgi:hypothetical protein